MDSARKHATSDRGRIAWGEYQLGLACFNDRQWKTALGHFCQADRKSRRGDLNYYLYMSYHGLALVYCGDLSGLNFCRHAAAAEIYRASVFHNLALAELHLNHRRRACDAVSAGLKIEPRHAGLLGLREEMGVRRSPCIPFLARANPLNKWLGRMTYSGKEKTVRQAR